MERIIKSIISNHPFVTLEKIQSILQHHGSSKVPSDVETTLSLKQAEWVYSEIEKDLHENASNQNSKKQSTVNSQVSINENSFKYLEDIKKNLQQAGANWRKNNLVAQENLYFELRCLYGISIQDTIKLFNISDKPESFGLEYEVGRILSSSKKTNNKNVLVVLIVSKLKEFVRQEYKKYPGRFPFTPCPREIDVPKFNENNYKSSLKPKKQDQKKNTISQTHKAHALLHHDKPDIHEEYLRKCSLGISLPILSFSTIQEAIKAAEYKYCLTSEFLCHLYRHIESNVALKKYFVDNILGSYIKNHILSKRKEQENSYDRTLLSIFSSETKEQESSFDILTPQDFILNWNDVKFYNGYYRIYPPRLGNIHFAIVDIKCKESICALNSLTNYLQNRLPAIHCVAKENKLIIKDEINLNQVIRYIKNASKLDSLNPEEDGVVKKKESAMPLFFVQNLEASRKLSSKFDLERLKQLKSRYINYLITKQMGEYRVIPCNERVIHSSQVDNKIECAFIFSIAASSPRKIILAIENLNIDRATMLFSFEERHYERALRGIYEYLRSGEINKRSSLRKWESYGLGGIQIEYHAVNHRNSENYSWSEVLKYRLRTM